MREEIDKKDIQILRIIQRNSKITTREIAKQLNLPVTTVFTRIKKLEQKGIIKEYRAILDAKNLEKAQQHSYSHHSLTEPQTKSCFLKES